MEDSYTERIISRLREEKLKVTPQRIAILRHLDGNTDHPSVEDIHREVCREFPAISLATVYNTLDTLVRISEVQTITVNPTRKHYDPNTTPHHHAICTHCHTIQDVFADFSDDLQLPAEVSARFRVNETAVYFRGVCRDCETPAN